jgi:hypothetical protein
MPRRRTAASRPPPTPLDHGQLLREVLGPGDGEPTREVLAHLGGRRAAYLRTVLEERRALEDGPLGSAREDDVR